MSTLIASRRTPEPAGTTRPPSGKVKLSLESISVSVTVIPPNENPSPVPKLPKSTARIMSGSLKAMVRDSSKSASNLVAFSPTVLPPGELTPNEEPAPLTVVSLASAFVVPERMLSDRPEISPTLTVKGRLARVVLMSSAEPVGPLVVRSIVVAALRVLPMPKIIDVAIKRREVV